MDTQILKAAANISDVYTNFVSVAARQAIAGTELTITKGSDGNWNTSDVKMFMKDIGNSKWARFCGRRLTTLTTSFSRTSPVETLYASFPFFLSINTTYAGQLLSPLLEIQDLSSNTQVYAARDLGKHQKACASFH